MPVFKVRDTLRQLLAVGWGRIVSSENGEAYRVFQTENMTAPIYAITIMTDWWKKKDGSEKYGHRFVHGYAWGGSSVANKMQLLTVGDEVEFKGVIEVKSVIEQETGRRRKFVNVKIQRLSIDRGGNEEDFEVTENTVRQRKSRKNKTEETDDYDF